MSGNTFIEYRYGRLDRISGATIGIDRGAGNGYVRYGFNNAWESHAVPPAENLAIRIGDSEFPTGVPSLHVEPSQFNVTVGIGEVLDTSLFVHNFGSTPLAYQVKTGTDLLAATPIQQPRTSPAAYPDYPKGFIPSRIESETATLDETLPDINGYAWANSRTDTSRSI